MVQPVHTAYIVMLVEFSTPVVTHRAVRAGIVPTVSARLQVSGNRLDISLTNLP